MEWKDQLQPLYASGLVKAPQIALLALYHERGAGSGLTRVTERTGLSLAHASTAVDALERKGLAIRHRPVRDGRTIAVYLTDRGKEVARGMLRALAEFRTSA